MNLLSYIQGNRKGKEAHRIEREAMEDPFLADALEGFDAVKADHIERIDQISKSLAPTSSHSGQKRMYIGIAASLMLLLSVGGYLLWQKSSDGFLALNQSVENVEMMRPSDVVEEPEPLAMTEQPLPESESEPLAMTERRPLESESKQTEKQRMQAPVIQQVESRSSDIATNPSIINESMASPPPPPPPVSPLEESSDAVAMAEVSDENQAIDMSIAQGYNSDISDSAMRIAQKPEVSGAARAEQPAPVGQRNASIENISDLQPVIGMQAYEKYLQEAKISPSKDECPQTGGFVEIKFTLKSGKPVDFVVVQSLCPAADREAIRLIENGSAWQGANGQSAIVSVFF
ncbi:MAG: hypothetical protein LBE56_06010 [Tannerella sp.]|jgi:hypothetical protein|nr:hypothetical protein [Tannerella sp.]